MCFNVEPPSTTLAQHCNNIRSTSLVTWKVSGGILFSDLAFITWLGDAWSAHEMQAQQRLCAIKLLAQCCFIVGPAAKMLGQHEPSIGSASCVVSGPQ